MLPSRVPTVSNKKAGIDLAVLDRLIDVAYWTQGENPIRRSMEVSDLSMAAFPSLLECEGLLCSKTYQGIEIFKYLSDVCDYEGALTLARRMADREPADLGEDGLTWVAAALHMYSNRLQELCTLNKDEWRSSPDREFAIELHEITRQLRPYREGVYAHPFDSGPVKTALYRVDLDFFDKLVGEGDLPKLVLRDVFSASRQGKHERQVEILNALLSMNERKLLNEQDLTLAAPEFWEKLRSNLDQVPQDRRIEVTLLAHRVGSDAFSINRMKDVKKNFLAKKFGPMILNQPWLALQVKNAGVDLSGTDMRDALRALEKASSLFERQWEGMVSNEQRVELKEILETLLCDISPDDFAKRKMPEAFVSVLSTLMHYKGWGQKVSDKKRDEILMSDLGL